MMKQVTIFAAFAAAVLAAGCAKNEVIQNESPQQAVTFSVYNGRMATKAVSSTTFGEINTTPLLQQSAGFGVFGFFSDNSAGSNDFTTSPSNNFYPNFMYNQLVSYNNGTTKWEYSPIKYWPNEYSTTAALSANVDKLSFVAYAPYVSTAAATAATEGIKGFSANNFTGDPTVTFQIPANENEQIDLLYSDAATTNLIKQELDGSVHFTFKHALSKLSIYPVAVINASSIPANSGADIPDGDSDGIPDATITVNSISIQGQFDKSGTLNIRTGAWSSSPESLTVNYSPATPLDVTTVNDMAEANASNPCAEFMFIPSSAGVKTYTVTIDYDVTYDDSALASALVVKNVIHKDISLDFEKGKMMKLYIGLGMTSVVFSAEVADWTDDTAQTVWLPVNTD